jgi:protein SCO1/2
MATEDKPQFTAPSLAQNFTLTDQNGNPFRMSEQRGKVVLLFFGYTHCPDVCPATLAIWKQVEEKLGDDAERVKFVFITVDPERDTTKRLKEHVELFSKNFIGLTGSDEELLPIYEVYNIYHEQDDSGNSAAGYLVSHTASSFLINPEGKLQSSFSFGATSDEIVRDIRETLP